MAQTVEQVFWLIVIAVCVIVGLGGGIFAVWNLWDSATNDRPEERKKGITVLIITVVSLVLILGVSGIMWSTLSGYLTSLPTTDPTTHLRLS